MTINVMHSAEVADALENAEHILLVTHVSPDGDAIGSLLALQNALLMRGKNVDAAVDGGALDFLGFLAGSERVRSELNEGQWDVMVSLDASDEARTGKCGEYGRANSKIVVNVDHHPTNTMFGDLYLVMSDAVSTTEVLYDWMVASGYGVDQGVAMPLLTGLVTDTIGFRTNNVTSRTLEIAQQLMQAGASLTEITQRTLDNRAYQVVDLWKHALKSVALEGQVIHAVVSQEALKEAKLRDVTDGGLVGFLVKVNEAMIAAVFKELDNGKIEISLRSKPGYDVAEVAFAVGGGGHVQAAGATIDGPIDAAKARILPMLRNAVNEGELVIS